jgi:hypothetical protein
MTRQPSDCYICGAPDARTMDHIFPKSLWSPPYPEDALTAPACHDCQKRLAPDETYFRTVAAASGAGRDPSARKLWEGKVIRSFDRDRRYREKLAGALRRIDWHTRGGVYLGPLVGLEGDLERIGNGLRKIVRGLSYLERGQTVMPFDLDWNYFHESPLTGRPLDFAMEMFHGLPLRTVGDVVRYKFTFPPKEPRVTVSWLAFYGRTMFTVWTGPNDPSELDRLIPSAEADND